MPAGLVAQALSPTSVRISWTDTNAGQAGAIVQRSTSGAPMEALATLSIGATSYLDSGLTPGTDYSYEVSSTNPAGNSAAAGPVLVTTPGLPPGAPQDLMLTTVSANEIDISWLPADLTATSFIIQRQSGNGVFAPVTSVNGLTTSFQDKGLVPSTTYTYEILAQNAGGTSAPSVPASAATFPGPPAPPTNLAAAAVSPTEVDLTWSDPNTDYSGFNIQRSTNGTTWVTIDSIGATPASYADITVSPATLYYYRVVATNQGGSSNPTNVASATTPPNPPAAPVNLIATVVSSTEIDLAWNAGDATQTGFLVLRGPLNGTPVQIAAVGSAITSYKDTTVTAGATYVYQVAAMNKGGQSALSNEATATTWPPTPLAPSSLQAAPVSQTQINLSWTDSNGDFTGFAILRKQGATAFRIVALTGPAARTFQDMTLLAGSAYTYEVEAVNGPSSSLPSNQVTATTLPGAPGSPTSLTATALGQTQIKLSWTAADATATSFSVRRKGAGGAFTEIASVSAASLTYVDTGLTPATAYTYEVFAINAGGLSAPSAQATATTASPAPPASPQGQTATVASPTEIDLAWNAAAGSVDTYTILRKTGAAAFAPVASEPAGTLAFADTGLQANVTYTYEVAAVNAGGTSSPSGSASATTPPYPPAAPLQLAGQGLSQTQIKLSWKAGDATQTGFVVQRQAADGTFITIVVLPGSSLTYSDSGLNVSSTYRYQVIARNAGGASAPSSIISASTLPNPPTGPTGLVAVRISQREVDLQWSDTAGDQTGFIVRRQTGSGPWVDLGTLGAKARAFADFGVTAGTTYYYVIVATNAGGQTTTALSLKVTTLPYSPPAPTAVVAQATSSNLVVVSWAEPDGVATQFLIQRKSPGTGFITIAVRPTGARGLQDTSVQPSTTYTYQVLAMNAGGISLPSAQAVVATPALAPATKGK
jgi:fibronectin type 3 domain-containing protein